MLKPFSGTFLREGVKCITCVSKSLGSARYEEKGEDRGGCWFWVGRKKERDVVFELKMVSF